MSNENLNYEEDHYCPVYEEVISADLCYDSLMCLNHSFRIESTKELDKVKDVEKARKICAECPYSEL